MYFTFGTTSRRYIKQRRNLQRDWSAHFPPVGWMSPQTGNAVVFLLRSASPGPLHRAVALAGGAERLVPACAAAWQLGHALPTPWPLNYDRIGQQLSSLEEYRFLSRRRGFGLSHQDNEGASSGCSAKSAEKHLVFSTGHFNNIFITGVSNSVCSSWLHTHTHTT